jgi:hypothetical protein
MSPNQHWFAERNTRSQNMFEANDTLFFADDVKNFGSCDESSLPLLLNTDLFLVAIQARRLWLLTGLNAI